MRSSLLNFVSQVFIGLYEFHTPVTWQNKYEHCGLNHPLLIRGLQQLPLVLKQNKLSATWLNIEPGFKSVSFPRSPQTCVQIMSSCCSNYYTVLMLTSDKVINLCILSVESPSFQISESSTTNWSLWYIVMYIRKIYRCTDKKTGNCEV